MAFAAVNSLVHTIKALLNSPRISITSSSSSPSTRQILQSAYDRATSLQATLHDCSEGVTDIDEGIIMEEARRLEDAIEFPISTHAFTFDRLSQDVDRFAEAAKKMQENVVGLWEEKAAKMVEDYVEGLFLPKQEEEEDAPSAAIDHNMVGLCDHFLEIRDELAASERGEAPVKILRGFIMWISGMAGIGKSTLAKKVFHDPSVKANFEGRAFVRVGQEFRRNDIFEAITAQLDLDSEKMIVGLEKSLCRILTVKKCLIVLDDVWEDIFQPEDLMSEIEDNGSRIFVTSRIDTIYPRFCIKMRFMNEEESWELLKRKVFGEEEECPSHLVRYGNKIAQKCGGLPLLIIAVAAVLLSEGQKNLEYWKGVADKPNSVLENASHQISKVLLSSYHQINEVEKLCFLYIAAFPQNHIVRCSTIINLWFVEGFQHDFSKHNFRTLCDKNLFMGHTNSWSSIDEAKACSLHIAYWYVSKRVAEKNKFLYIINSWEHDLDEGLKSHRRLAVYKNAMFAIEEVRNSMAYVPTMRSLLCTGEYHQYQVEICWKWRLLRVLDALTIRFYEFPIEVVELICLRYLALTSNGNLPRSISKLWNLQFLILHQHLSIKRVAPELSVPVEIWDLQELIHLEIVGRNLPDPPPGSVLPNLTKLLDVGVESCTKEILESIPKLKKLRIQIELAPDAPQQTFRCLDDIHNLRELYSFRCVVMYPTLLSPPPPLSISISSLRHLSLSGFGYPWEDMSKIAELPNLKKLKLECYAFEGEKWDAKEMRFSSLNYLFIEDTDLVHWTIGDETFPSLWCLTMKNCYKLQQIPILLSEFEVDVELIDCDPSVEACANQWKAESVYAKYSWNEKKLKS